MPPLKQLCRTPDQLHAWIKTHLGLNIPRTPVCAHHQAPFEYLINAYFEPSRDQIVWAPRGGGKTSLAAVATLLDLIHKPGCSVRVLGGSLEQSLRLWDYLMNYFGQDNEALYALIANPRATARRIELHNQSVAAVLTQSQKSVRGLRVQKLRCDEIELFDADVWSAAQLTTRSVESCKKIEESEDGSLLSSINSPRTIRGSIEALSTMHASGGLMQKLVDQASTSGARLVRWCLLDVLEHCPSERPCESCPLWEECKGVAKTRCDGFFRIDDAAAMKSRVSLDVWQTEILCKRPSRQDGVFPMLDSQLHVRAEAPFVIDSDCHWWLAMDFGYNAPLVCLWIVARNEQAYVIDEHVARQRTLNDHLNAIHARPWPRAPRVACDPAGNARNEQTARSNVDLLRARGYKVKSRASRIVDGIELVRAALLSASGQTRLTIHPRCARLIQSMHNYRYVNETTELPDKDGENDHAVDALRYFFINHRTHRTAVKRY